MLFAGSNSEIINESYKSLSESFEIKDLGEVKQFIGIDIHKSSDGFFCINQSQYITKIASELGLSQAKSQKYPIHPGYLNMTGEDFLPSNSDYRKVIGMLLYVSTNSRPDISASVCILAQRVEQPRKIDLEEALRVVKYLNGTKDFKLHLNNPDASQHLVAYSDANFGECKLNGKSNSGVICFVNGGPVIWSSRKQTNVALSTCEAEYYAVTEAAKEVLWLKSLLSDFYIESLDPILLLNDNQSCISMISNGDFKQRTKYIGVRYHFIRDWVQRQVIDLRYVATEYNIADMMTKPLNGPKLSTLRTASGLLEPTNESSSRTTSILTFAS
jgi:hypothetical protein